MWDWKLPCALSQYVTFLPSPLSVSLASLTRVCWPTFFLGNFFAQNAHFTRFCQRVSISHCWLPWLELLNICMLDIQFANRIIRGADIRLEYRAALLATFAVPHPPHLQRAPPPSGCAHWLEGLVRAPLPVQRWRTAKLASNATQVS